MCTSSKTMFIVVGLVLAVVPALASPAVPVAKLTCGILEGQDIDMPILAVGTGGYKGVNATAAIGRALAAGFTHVHTAFDYFNLPYVGAALSAYPRESLFISSMTSPCIHKAPPARNMTDPDGCYNLTLAEISSLLTSLKLDALDLLMLHGPSEPFGHDGPCSSLACTLNRAQWRAYQTLRAAGKVKAIGVSNFCQSCLACLNSTSPADTPAVNQIQVHVGQGSADPGGGLLSYCAKRGIVVQAYEPLAGGELVTDADCAAIGARHNRSAAQVALRWVLQRAPSLAVRSGTSAHLMQDLGALDFSLDVDELAALDVKTGPKGEAGGRCSWGCTQ